MVDLETLQHLVDAAHKVQILAAGPEVSALMLLVKEIELTICIATADYSDVLGA